MTVESNTQIPALQPPDISHHIRSVRGGDLKALRRDCWSHRSVTRSRECLKTIDSANHRQRGLGIVVMLEGTQQIIAYGQIMRLTKCYEISDLIVSEQYRNQGIGTAMIQYLIHSLPDNLGTIIEIGVADDNPRALALYENLGFTRAYELCLSQGRKQETILYLRLELTS